MATRLPQDPEQFAAEPRSIDLRDYWQTVRRRWVLIVLLGVLGAVIAAGYAYKVGPTYTATAEVNVAPVTQGPLNQLTQNQTQVNISTEQAIAQSAPVIIGAARLLGVQPTVLQAKASKSLSVTVPGLSDVLQIAWSAGGPKQAKRGANAFAEAYLRYRHSQLASQISYEESILSHQVHTQQAKIATVTAQLNTVPSGTSRHLRLEATFNELTSQLNTEEGQLQSLPTYNDSGGSVIPAALPLAPSGLGKKVLLILGLLLGLLIGLVIAFLRDAFDDRIRDTGRLERALGAATLAVLPPARGRIAVQSPADGRITAGRRGSGGGEAAGGGRTEAVRALRATLVAVGARQDVRTILIVGADDSVSASRIAAELGLAMAESGRRVLLVGADMRSSSLPQLFAVPNVTGLSSMLTGGGDPEVFARQPKSVGGSALAENVAKRLALIPSGPQVAQPLAVLDSGVMVGLLSGQREAFDFVLLDSPPATVAADAVALAAHVDGVIVVASAVRSSSRVVAALRQRLDQVGARVIGGVMIGKGPAARHRHGHVDQLPAGGVTVLPAEPGRWQESRHAETLRPPAPPVLPDSQNASGGRRSNSLIQGPS
jgi:Mrp family chromosome partitioning ATPase/capsular polysaccharide biosynthesis protein